MICRPLHGDLGSAISPTGGDACSSAWPLNRPHDCRAPRRDIPQLKPGLFTAFEASRELAPEQCSRMTIRQV